MAIHSRWEKTVPTLLDRLVESSPVGAERGGGEMFVSPQRYLESVKRDLLWLLKTEVQRSSEIPVDDLRESVARGFRPAESGELFEPKFLADFPHASNSVVAYGIPALRGDLGMRTAGPELIRNIERAIRMFEPRLNPKTLRVRLVPQDEADSDGATVSSLAFVIEGDVKMKPLPEHLLLKASFTPALAQWRIEGVAHGS
jgi:type VI secretion system protein ImpF